MSKLQKLIEWFENKDRVLVALSGGVDSALVAYAAFQKLKNNAIAVTADYQTLSKDELNSAKKVCSEIGISHRILYYNELENKNFVRNDKNRCFYCRSELANHLKALSTKIGTKFIVDGTNADDLDEYRPGIKALKDNDVQSPLVETGFTKQEVRKEAKIAGLTVYDRPSNSCLASRIPWGQHITPQRLTRIEVAEEFIKQFGIRQVRVRDLNGTAKIEVAPNDIKFVTQNKILNEIKVALQEIGFQSVIVDPEGYRPGKINVIVD